jgi:hypothetical protein
MAIPIVDYARVYATPVAKVCQPRISSQRGVGPSFAQNAIVSAAFAIAVHAASQQKPRQERQREDLALLTPQGERS